MEGNGKQWKIIEDYRRLWKIIEDYGILWNIMEYFRGFHGSLWKLLEIFGRKVLFTNDCYMKKSIQNGATL